MCSFTFTFHIIALELERRFFMENIDKSCCCSWYFYHFISTSPYRKGSISLVSWVLLLLPQFQKLCELSTMMSIIHEHHITIKHQQTITIRWTLFMCMFLYISEEAYCAVHMFVHKIHTYFFSKKWNIN